jgi:predicted ATPase
VTQLKALGGLRLESSPGSPPFTQPKPLLLLAYLSLEGSQQRRHLAELFWRDGNRMKSLSMTLTRLRQGVGEVIEVDDKRAKANLSSDAGDLLESLDKSDWQKASELYRGAFLEGVILDDWSSELEEWVYTTREYLAERVQYALLHLAEAAAKQQDFDRTRDLAERAYKLPGLAGTEIINLKRLYPLLCASSSLLAPEVRKELEGYGLSVSLSREEAKAKFQGEKRTAHQLPARQTSFIGRDVELTELATLLGKVQLVTLLGAGGVGKTRLALQLAFEQQTLNTFENIYFIPLESLSSADLILPTILSSLGLSQQSKIEPLTQLAELIAGRCVLLVLDNLEHLLADVNILSALIGQCPNLKLLVTSRERLGLEEEHLFPLEGLAFPPSNTPFEEAVNFDAVTLFTERAQQLQPQFDLTEQLGSVLRICALVEGLPLGLELAASWTRLMSCGDIAYEIERGLEFLATSTRNVPERHRSLKAIFDYSWNLLTSKEREILRQLSVFVGGFRREAARAVTGATIPLLASLVDKSLLRVLPNGRYDRHPLLYQFTREKLAEDTAEQEQARERHGHYYLNLLRVTRQQLYGEGQQDALRSLDEEHFNTTGAWHWAGEHQLFEKMQGSRPALTVFFDERGRYQEGEALFAETVQRCNLSEPIQKRLAAYLLGDRAWFVYSLGDFVTATKLGEESLTLMCSLQDREGLTKSLNVLACIAMDSKKFEVAEVYLQEFLELARGLGNTYFITVALLNLGNLKHAVNESLEAERYYREVIHLCRGQQDKINLVGAFNDFAVVLRETGRFQEALALLGESLAISSSMELQTSQMYAQAELAEVRLELGQTEQALEAGGRALALSESTNNKRQHSHNHEILARIYLRLHDLAKASHHFLQSLELAAETDDTERMLRAMRGLTELSVYGEVKTLETLLEDSALSKKDKAKVKELLEQWQVDKSSKPLALETAKA